MYKNTINVGLVNLIPDEDAPPMNLVYLGTYLKKNGFNVELIDPTYDKRAFDGLVRRFDIIGISSMTTSYCKAIRLAERISQTFDKPIIIGGPHISLVPQSLSKHFLAGVMGEGEQVMVNLCNALRENGRLNTFELSNIPGLVYWSDDQIVINEPCKQIKDLNTLPVPEFSLPDERYFKKRWLDWSGTTGISGHISTSRGCPYNCIFCSGQRLWNKVRLQSSERVFQEIEALVTKTKQKVDHIVIDDDLFLVSRSRLEELATLMERSSMAGKVNILCSARANLINDDMCRILKKIGIKSLNFGFESGSNRSLKYLKGGNVTVRQNKMALQLCRKYGFEVSGNLILGHPEESIEDMMETLNFMDFAIENGCYKIGVFVMTPLPATPIWEIAKDRNLVSDNMDWDMLSFYNYENPMLLSHRVPQEKFEAIFKMARDKSYQAWLKKRWSKMLFNDFRRVLRKILENPKRASVMFNNIFLKRAYHMVR